MILIALGANLPGPHGAPPWKTCLAAVQAVAELPGLRLERVSRWYETAPVPRSDQPNYVNGVVRLERAAGSAVSPEALLAQLHAIEDRFGRRRSGLNSARTLDLDLIDMDGLVRDSPDPVLPHPRAHLRAFVLLPLLDVAPDWVHPTNGRSARVLLSAADMSGIALLASQDPVQVSSRQDGKKI